MIKLSNASYVSSINSFKNRERELDSEVHRDIKRDPFGRTLGRYNNNMNNYSAGVKINHWVLRSQSIQPVMILSKEERELEKIKIVQKYQDDLMHSANNDSTMWDEIKTDLYELFFMIDIELQKEEVLKSLIGKISYCIEKEDSNYYKDYYGKLLDLLSSFEPTFKNLIMISEFLGYKHQGLGHMVATKHIKSLAYTSRTLDNLMHDIEHFGCIRATVRYKNLHEIYGVFMSSGLTYKEDAIAKILRKSGCRAYPKDAIIKGLKADNQALRKNKLFIVR